MTTTKTYYHADTIKIATIIVSIAHKRSIQNRESKQIKANCRKFLDLLKFAGFTDESGRYASNELFSPKNIL